MPEDFTIHVIYKGNPEEIHCRFRSSAYTYQFLCQIDNNEMILEKDDEGKIRAMLADPLPAKNKKPDLVLVRAVIEEMERILQ